jgi:hypothetical protein
MARYLGRYGCGPQVEIGHLWGNPQVADSILWISRLLMPEGTAVDHGLAWGIPLMSEETPTELTEVLS